MDPFKKLPEVLNYIEHQYSNPSALNYQQKGGWHSVSTETFLHDIKMLALALVDMGLQRGDPVGIVAVPSPRWTIADCAIIMAGGVSVPLFANLSEENFVFEVAQTSLKFLFVGGQEQWQMFQRHKRFFETVVRLDGPGDDVAISYEEALKKGQALNEKDANRYKKLEEAINETDLATIVYTSGSTGVPKGVELTHLNITGIINVDLFHLDSQNDRYLSILPLAHIFGRALNFNMLAWGVSVYYFNDLKNLGPAFREIQPTLVVVVPRLLEKVYDKMLSGVNSASFFKRKIGQWAFHIAHKEKKSAFDRIMSPIADKLVYSRLRENLGGKVRIVISGGAHLNPHLAHFFTQVGIPIYEGWGMTEASTVGVNLPGKQKMGTVGKCIEGVEVKISDRGEILVRGLIVTRGYYRNRHATELVIDSEGWFHTGDKGKMDSEGFVTIEGRVKEIFKTSTGEYIIPVPIEQSLCRSSLIDMAMVIGEGKKFASCLLFPNFEVLHSLKAAYGQTHLSDEEFLNSEQIRKEMQQILKNINDHLNHWEQIHDYRFIPVHLSVETGELTPSMKIRREIVLEKYRSYIESIYPKEEVE